MEWLVLPDPGGYYTADTVSGDILYAPPTLPPMPPVLSVPRNDEKGDAGILVG